MARPAGDPDRAGDTVIQARLTVFGASPSPATVTVVERGLGQRAGHALVALLACWALAFVSVFIVLAHFILVPAFFIAGLVLAYRRLRAARVIVKIHGACPRCGADEDFAPPTWGSSVDCPRCKNQLRLVGLDDGETPASSDDRSRA